MTNIHPYFEVADRMEMIATLVGKRTEGCRLIARGSIDC